MKNKFLLCLFLLFPVLVQCQIIYSEVYAKSKRPQTYDRLTVGRAYVKKGNELMVLKQADKTFFFQKFDLTTLKVISSTTPEYSTGDAKDFSTVNLGGKDYLIFESQVRKARGPGSDGTWKTVIQEIDFENCGLKGEVVDIPINKFNQYGYNLNVSPDSTKFLTASFIRGDNPINSKNFYTANITVLDNNINEVWKHEIKLPYPESKIEEIQNVVDNLGNVYIHISVYDMELKKKFSVFFKASSDGKLVEIPIQIQKFMSGTQLLVDKNGDVFCIGSYGERTEGGIITIEGFFSFRIKDNQGTDVLYTKSSTLTTRLNLNIDSRDQGNSPGLSRVFPLMDGGKILLFSYFAKTSKAFIHYIAIKTNEQNEIEWCKDLPKWENEDVVFADDPYFLGELFKTSFERNNKLYILDVKHRKQEGKNYLSFDSRVPGVSYIRMYVIDSDTGTFKTHFFQLDRELKGYNFLPSYFYLIDETSIIFEGYSKKDEILVKIPIKE